MRAAGGAARARAAARRRHRRRGGGAGAGARPALLPASTPAADERSDGGAARGASAAARDRAVGRRVARSARDPAAHGDAVPPVAGAGGRGAGGLGAGAGAAGGPARRLRAIWSTCVQAGRGDRSRRAVRDAGRAAATRARRWSRIRAPSRCAAASSTCSCRSIASRCASSCSATWSSRSASSIPRRSGPCAPSTRSICIRCARRCSRAGTELRERILAAGDRAVASVVEDARAARSDRRGRGLLRHRGADAGVPRAHGVARRVPAGGRALLRRRARRAARGARRGARRRRGGVSARASTSTGWRFPPDDFFLDEDELRALLERGQPRRGAAARGRRRRAQSPSVRFARRAAPRSGDRAASARAPRSTRSCCARWRAGCATGATRACARSSSVPNLQHAERLESLLKGYQIIPHVHRAAGAQSISSTRARSASTSRSCSARSARGFQLPLDRVGAHRRGGDLRREGGARARRKKAKRRASTQADFKHLEPGDFVVHTLHGVGIYKGLTKLPLRSGDARGRRRLPAPRVRRRRALPAGLAARRGAAATPAPRASSRKLDKLGGVTWEKTRAQGLAEVRAARRGAAAALRAAQGAARPLASRSRRTRDHVPRVRGDVPVRGDARSAEGDRRRARRHASTARRWIAWSAATSATARPRSRCARRSRRCSAASRWRCWRRRRCSSSSTAVTFADALQRLPGAASAVAVALPAQGGAERDR